MTGVPNRGARRPEEKGRWDQKHTAGRMADTRKAWVTLPKFDLIMFVGVNEDETKPSKSQDFDPDLPPVRFEMRVPGRRYPTIVSLTYLTTEELDAFKQFMDHAFERARPICEELDRKAQEAYDNGDDGYARLYRPVPQFFDRERDESEHDQSVQSGSEGSDEERHDPGADDVRDDDGGGDGSGSDNED